MLLLQLPAAQMLLSSNLSDTSLSETGPAMAGEHISKIPFAPVSLHGQTCCNMLMVQSIEAQMPSHHGVPVQNCSTWMDVGR